jgi:hypothetical protein
MPSSFPRPAHDPAELAEADHMLFTTQRIGDIARAAYGSVAAMLQADRTGTELMLRDLDDTCEDAHEALWAVAILTLERIGTAAEQGHHLDSEAMATDVIARADVFAPDATLAIRAAATRLDAFAASSVGLENLVSPFELLLGALALLAAALAWGAATEDRAADDVCRDLCTAAMMAIEP